MNNVSDNRFSFEELEEDQDISGKKIFGFILDDFQTAKNATTAEKMQTLQSLQSERGNEYLRPFLKKVYTEVKVWLGDHGFPLQKRQEVLKLMKEGETLKNIFGLVLYDDLKVYVYSLFTTVIDQASKPNDDFVADHAKPYETGNPLRIFLQKHIEKMSALGDNTHTLVMVLFNNDSMDRTELLDTVFGKKQGPKRIAADKNISIMIEEGMIDEEGGKLSLHYS